jgi:hypothetical protein
MARATVWVTLALAALANIASADVEFTKPKAGDKVPAGSLKAEWKDSGVKPAINPDLLTYELWLCTGGNEQAQIVRKHTRRSTMAPSNGRMANSVVRNNYF